ncbi:MAG: hypothetical protein KKD74_02420 [Bacteroidetes bacterium]|nr:hypothetical protein [Bacteroidota bacterium]
MKRTMMTMILTLCTLGFAIAQKEYRMFELIYLTPKAGMTKVLEENLKAHNKKFHTAAPYEAFIKTVVVGEHEGDFVWLMGPTTFTSLDGRPDDDAHKADWATTVEPFVEKAGNVEYWKMKEGSNYDPEGGMENYNMQHIRFWEIKPGKYEAFMNALMKVTKVFKDNSYKESWSVYINQFSTNSGRDIAAVSNMKNWATFDQDDTFVADYEKIYGKDSWKAAMAVFNDCTASYTEEIGKFN